jgi:hypothetical protein
VTCNLHRQKKLCSCPSLPIINYLWADNTQLIIALFSSSMGVVTMNTAWQRIPWRLSSLATETQPLLGCTVVPTGNRSMSAGSTALRQEKVKHLDDLVSSNKVHLSKGTGTTGWKTKLKHSVSGDFLKAFFAFHKIHPFQVYSLMNFCNCITTTKPR